MAQDLVDEGVGVGEVVLVGQGRVPAAAHHPVQLILGGKSVESGHSILGHFMPYVLNLERNYRVL